MTDHANSTDAAPQRNIDDYKGGMIVVVGLVTTILIVVIVLCTQAWFNARRAAAFADANYYQRPLEVSEYLQSQQQTLSTSQWDDEKQTAARIPLDAAMDLYLTKKIESKK